MRPQVFVLRGRRSWRLHSSEAAGLRTRYPSNGFRSVYLVGVTHRISHMASILLRFSSLWLRKDLRKPRQRQQASFSCKAGLLLSTLHRKRGVAPRRQILQFASARGVYIEFLGLDAICAAVTSSRFCMRL